MKKIIAALFLMTLATAATCQTADEILLKYENAAGGRQKLEEIRYLEVYSTLRMSVMGNNIDLPVTLVREKGKLFRRQIGGIMGMGDSFTMVTDTAGYILIPVMRGFGGPGGPGGAEPTLMNMKPQEVSEQQYELDCAGAFGELVNYAAKGHKAELVGTEKVSKVPCFKIKLILKTGQSVIYYIDQQTFLVKQMEATGDMAANLAGLGSLMKAYGSNMKKDTKCVIQIKEYEEVKGVKYPNKLNLSFGPVDSEIENSSIKINEGLEEKWYHPTTTNRRN